MKKAVFVAITVLGTLFFVIGIPLIINASYQCDTVIIVTQWGAKDVLNYYGAVLGSFVTIAGLAITICFTKKQIHRESYLKTESDKWAKTETVVSDILNEINPMPTLKQVMDTGFTDPAKAISLLQKYQMSCRTATDQLSAYLNTADYPKVKELIQQINEEVIHIYETDFRGLLQLKGLSFAGFQFGILLYTSKCSTSFAIPLESFLVEYVRCHEILETKQFAPKISSQISLRVAHSVLSMLMKIAPSSAKSLCSSFSRGYIIHSHLS